MAGKLDREFIMPTTKLRPVIIYYLYLCTCHLFVKLKFVNLQFEGYVIIASPTIGGQQ